MPRLENSVNRFWKEQPRTSFNQAGAVQNTWYPVVTVTRPSRLRYFLFGCTVANETLEFEITIDGVVYLGTQAAVFGTNYWTYRRSGTTLIVVTTEYMFGNIYSTLECGSFSVRMRKTTATGASALFVEFTADYLEIA